MAILRLRFSYKVHVFLGLCLVLLIVLLSTEVYFSFTGDSDGPEPVGFFQREVNSKGLQEGEHKVFDFLVVDENWIDRYSEGGLTLASNVARFCLILDASSRK